MSSEKRKSQTIYWQQLVKHYISFVFWFQGISKFMVTVPQSESRLIKLSMSPFFGIQSCSASLTLQTPLKFYYWYWFGWITRQISEYKLWRAVESFWFRAEPIIAEYTAPALTRGLSGLIHIHIHKELIYKKVSDWDCLADGERTCMSPSFANEANS